MAFPDTGIAVTLDVRDGQVARVALRSGRLVQAARLLEGRRPDQITGLLPTVFSLCGTAQALAGAMAMEEAVSHAPLHPGQRMARRLLTLVEVFAEHGLSCLRDWPLLLGEAPDLESARDLRPLIAAMRSALYPDGDWARAGGGRLAPDRARLAELLRQMTEMAVRLFAGGSGDWENNPEAFDHWLDRGDCVASRLLALVRRRGLEKFGRAPIHTLPEEGPHDLAQRLEEDRDGRYVAAPDLAGQPAETSSLSRRLRHPLIMALMVRHGNGLETRFAARLADMAAALREVAELVQDLPDAPMPTALLAGTGAGLGLVDAARGLLVHRVELEEGVVRRYQILAPTEWNFHPDGPLVRGLMGAEDCPSLDWRARMLVAALDPCVACTVGIGRHA